MTSIIKRYMATMLIIAISASTVNVDSFAMTIKPLDYETQNIESKSVKYSHGYDEKSVGLTKRYLMKDEEEDTGIPSNGIETFNEDSKHYYYVYLT